MYLALFALHDMTPPATVCLAYVFICICSAVALGVKRNVIEVWEHVLINKTVIAGLKLTHTASTYCKFFVSVCKHKFYGFLNDKHVVLDIVFFIRGNVIPRVTFTLVFNRTLTVFCVKAFSHVCDGEGDKLVTVTKLYKASMCFNSHRIPLSHVGYAVLKSVRLHVICFVKHSVFNFAVGRVGCLCVVVALQ